MRISRTLILSALGAVILLLPWNLAGCNPLDPGSDPTQTVFNLPPTVVIEAIPDPPRGVAPLTIQFDSGSSSDDGVIVDRQWDFGDGTTTQDIAPRHIFQQNGTFEVTLTLTDDEGARASNALEVIVTERPVAVINVDRLSADNAPATFQFDASQSYDPDADEESELDYRWDFGDGAREVVPIVNHTYGLAGTYRVVLTVTDENGIVGTAEEIIEVGIAQPELSFRSPPSDLANLVITKESPLWVHVAYEVDPGVPFTLRAGLDEDVNPDNDNEIQLDTDATDDVLVNDLNLTIPTPLDLNAAGINTNTTYYLWIELDTDRTVPTREYLVDPRFNPDRAIPIRVLPNYPSTFTDVPDAQLNPSANDEANIVAAPQGGRQIVDLGPLDTGDRVFLSLLDVPGYSTTFSQTEYSVKLVDSQQRVFTWYLKPGTLFSRDSKIVVGHSSLHYYLILEDVLGGITPSVQVRIQRQFALDSQPRRQYVFLDFDGTSDNIAVAFSRPFQVPALSVSGMDTTVLNTVILNRVSALFAPYDFVILSSAAGDAEPTQPHLTVYFDNSGNVLQAAQASAGTTFALSDDLLFYGLPDFIDPRNETLTGRAVVSVSSIISDFPTLTTETQLGTAIANSAAHQVGLLCGLYETQTTPPTLSTDIMTIDETRLPVTTLDFTIENLAPHPVERVYGTGATGIGIQDGPQLLGELFQP